LKNDEKMVQPIPTQLSEDQVNLVRLMVAKFDAEDLREVRKLISKYLYDKVQREANEVWEEKGYTTETLTSWMQES
jgi:hypothetical protein